MISSSKGFDGLDDAACDEFATLLQWLNELEDAELEALLEAVATGDGLDDASLEALASLAQTLQRLL